MLIQIDSEDLRAIAHNHGLFLAGLQKICVAAEGPKEEWEKRVATAVGNEIDVLMQVCKSMLSTLDKITEEL